jgi:hypothetical protein
MIILRVPQYLNFLFARVLAIAILLVSLTYSGGAYAGAGDPVELSVDTHIDSNDPLMQICAGNVPEDCSLRGAISRANADPTRSYTIRLPAGEYALTLAGPDDENRSGDLDLAGQITLLGDGQESTRIAAKLIDRVLDVQPGAVATFTDISLREGQAELGQPGGGVRNRGELKLDNVTVSTNYAGAGRMADPPGAPAQAGGNGGGIFNSGQLTLLYSRVANNRAGAGGDLPSPGNYESIIAGAGGSGGGIYNAGQLEIQHSQVVQNQAGIGGRGPDNFGENSTFAGGTGGDGGGIANLGWLSGSAVQVQENQAGAGGRAGEAWYASGGGGHGGHGGGIYNGLWLQLLDSQLENNQSGPGGENSVGIFSLTEKPPGYPGSGGGLYNFGQAYLQDSLVASNSLAPATSLTSYQLPDGGGVFNAPKAHIALQDCSLSGNQSSGAGGGLANAGEAALTAGVIDRNNALDLGGGLFNSGTLVASQLTIQENTTGPGYQGFQMMHYKGAVDPPIDGRSPDGGGFYNIGEARLNAVQVLDNRAGAGGHGGNSTKWYPGANGADGGSGGGILNCGELEINRSRIQGNQAGKGGERGYGPGYGYGDGENGAGGSGGGIYNCGKLSAAFVDLLDNLTGPGYSIAEPGGDGGGLANLDDLTWRDSQVLGNRTMPGGNGGGFFLEPVNADVAELTVSNTQVISNTAAMDGGGLYLTGGDLRLVNLVIAANQVGSGQVGSGIYLADHTLHADHLTFAGNTGGDGSGVYVAAATLTLTESIIAGQQVGIYAAQGAQIQLESTLWGAGAWANTLDWAGAGNLDPGAYSLHADPLFVAPNAHDFHLAAASPAVDAGVEAGAPYDLDNQPRPQPGTGAPDLGADEVWPSLPLSQATIGGPTKVTAEQPVAYTASISPPDATPNISYFWLPAPQSGQWTAQVVYVFPTAGTYHLLLTAFNAGSEANSELTVVVLPNIRKIYLPLSGRGAID